MSVLTTDKKQTTRQEYSRAERDDAVDKLITARIGLLMRHPFFGNMATHLALVEASDWLQTLATDGRNFYYNIGFVNSLSIKQCEFGFAHEVLHNVFDHINRRDSRDQRLANIAMDYAVNQICKDDKIGEFPTVIKLYQDNKYRGWSFEQIYEELYDKAEKINLDKIGQLLDEHLDGDGDEGNGAPVLSEEERQKIRDEIKEAMLQAASAVGAGNVPAAVERLIKDITEPKMNWRDLIRMNIQSIIKSNFSFARVNRKSQMCGAILPGMLNEETIDVCCAIDMSGSISDAQGSDFISEIKGIMEEFQEFNLQLWCFDTKVYNHEKFDGYNADDITSYKVKGGGGTDFDANFKFMKDNDIVPKKFIMFTDGYPCGSWGDENYCDTLFVIHGSESIVPPFGQYAYYSSY
jgi:predicted metal-dependent peptidase